MAVCSLLPLSRYPQHVPSRSFLVPRAPRPLIRLVLRPRRAGGTTRWRRLSVLLLLRALMAFPPFAQKQEQMQLASLLPTGTAQCTLAEPPHALERQLPPLQEAQHC